MTRFSSTAVAALTVTLLILALCPMAQGGVVSNGLLFKTEHLPPQDSLPKLKAGDPAPDFELPSITGELVRLSSFRDKKNVVITFVPAAFTPVCSEQWPGYNIAQELFDTYEATMLGITTDNLPSLHAWTQEMGGVWFTVLSDFWPHGDVCQKYGILRSNGISERAIVIIDKTGRIAYFDVGDINKRPDLGIIIKELKKLQQP